MGVDLDGEVPIVGTELYDTDFDAFVEVRRRVPRYPTRLRLFSPASDLASASSPREDRPTLNRPPSPDASLRNARTPHERRSARRTRSTGS